MAIVTYYKTNINEQPFEDFEKLFYGSRMQHLASDLLSNGLTSQEITEALNRAMTCLRLNDIQLRKHLIPIYTSINGEVFKDCKMSDFGYAMLIINANPCNVVIAQLQLKIVSKYLNTRQNN